MRIIYCIDEMSQPGGIGRVTAIKANWLAEHGHDVWIVSSNQCDEKDYYELHPLVKRKDFAIGFQLGIDNGNLIMKAIRKIGKMHRYRKGLESLIDEIKPDIIVSTFTNDSDFLYKLRDGSKKVLEFHFSHDGFRSQIKYGPQTLKNKLLLLYRLKKHEWIAKKYDAFVVLTKEDAEAWRGYDNLYVIPNMLSFEPKKTSTCMENRVIAVGRLDFQKKFDRLIDIWALVNKNCPDWKLDIFGKGPDRDRLLIQIKNLGLEGVITIKEPTKNIESEYANSSVFAMTSTYEGMPMTLLEAISMGVPCVAYGCKCGPKDIIDNDINGYCVEEGNKIVYVQKLIELLKDTQKRVSFGEKAKNKANEYSVDLVMNRWMLLFQKLFESNLFSQTIKK